MMWPSFSDLDKRILTVFLVSLATTLVGFFLMVLVTERKGLDVRVLTGDSKGYVLLAQNLLERGMFSVAQSEPYYPESFRAPGFPAFLASLFALFSFSKVALFVHALLVGMAPVLLYLIFRDWHERAAFWGAIVFAFEPVRIFLASSFLSDGLFTLVFLAVLLFVEQAHKERSWRYALLAGVLLGFAILIRPIAMFLPILFAIYLAIRVDTIRAKVAYVSLFLAAIFMVVFPWMYRNHAIFNSWNISSVGAANLMLYNAPEFVKWHQDERAKALVAQFQAEQAALSREDALSLERSEVFTYTFREVIRGAELKYLTFHIVKTIPFFITDGLRDTIRIFSIELGAMPNISTSLMSGDFHTLSNYLKSGGITVTLFLIGIAVWVLVTLAWGLNSVLGIFRGEGIVLFIAVLIVYFALLTGPVSNARYRVPVEGLMLVAASAAISRIYRCRIFINGMKEKECNF